MTLTLDRLYELLPDIYRLRDADYGQPLRDLLRVIAEQVDIVEADITQLYDNWFIETCQDWVVPYIGDLLGYTPVHEAGEPGGVHTMREREYNKILIPRRDVADTIHNRRRRGTLAVLELLARDTAGWPARAVEFYRLLGVAQAINHVRLDRGNTVDLRHGDALDRIEGPFDELAHTVEVRRPNSHLAAGRYNIPSIGLFVWRLHAYPITDSPACCLEEIGSQYFTFSVLGNDSPLYAPAQPEPDPAHIAEENNVPTPIRRRAFERNVKRFYGSGKSLQVWIGTEQDDDLDRRYVGPENIIVADLSDWKRYRAPQGKLAIDPVLGRMLFNPGQAPDGVWVSYYYGFSADLGGGEYARPILHPFEPEAPVDYKEQFAFYRVGEREALKAIEEAVERWKEVRASRPHAVIEIADSGVYTEQLNLELNAGESLQIRAASRKRPTIYLIDRRKNRPDSLKVKSKTGGCFSLDGLLIAGRGVHVGGKVAEVNIRHCTLVPGWDLEHDCEPQNPTEPSLELFKTEARCNIEHSILGTIRVFHSEVLADPLRVHLSDTILDATGSELEALSDDTGSYAHVLLTAERCTVIGTVWTHAIDRAEDSIFLSLVKVARRQIGCMRFCYVPPESRTPRRYNCQPDRAMQAIEEELRAIAKRHHAPEPGRAEIELAQKREARRVRPQFNSMRYGTPTYYQLAHSCAIEIKRGASDKSEMGAFHDLYQPQREANLRARLEEYTLAGMNAGIIFAS
jgi:hypothetical protein